MAFEYCKCYSKPRLPGKRNALVCGTRTQYSRGPGRRYIGGSLVRNAYPGHGKVNRDVCFRVEKKSMIPFNKNFEV